MQQALDRTGRQHRKQPNAIRLTTGCPCDVLSSTSGSIAAATADRREKALLETRSCETLTGGLLGPLQDAKFRSAARSARYAAIGASQRHCRPKPDTQNTPF